jgi:hypothetical protein
MREFRTGKPRIEYRIDYQYRDPKEKEWHKTYAYFDFESEKSDAYIKKYFLEHGVSGWIAKVIKITKRK